MKDKIKMTHPHIVAHITKIFKLKTRMEDAKRNRSVCKLNK